MRTVIKHRYWLCCGSSDYLHFNGCRVADCTTYRARWGTAEEHSKWQLARTTAVQRPNTKHVPLPNGSGELISATVFAGKLLIACENGVWVRSDSATWEKVGI